MHSKKIKSPVDHFSSGVRAWETGFESFFRRNVGIASTLILTVGSMGLPWWWPTSVESFPVLVTIPTKLVVAGSLLSVGALAIGSMLIIRYRSQRSLRVKDALHSLAHAMRDASNTAFSQPLSSLNKKRSCEKLEELCNNLANLIQSYFTILSGDPSVAAAIRLCYSETPDKVAYHTFGRSSGLSQGRKDTSEAISANSGIPRFFIEEKKCKGVLIYNDIDEAAQCGTFHKTQNEKTFPLDIITLMVAPLNAWDGKRVSMIGLLYVSSRKQQAFGLKDTDTMRFLADCLASTIAVVLTPISGQPPISRNKSSK